MQFIMTGACPTRRPGSSTAQVSDLAFTGDTPEAGSSYTVMVNGHAYTVRVGDNHLISILNVAGADIGFETEASIDGEG